MKRWKTLMKSLTRPFKPADPATLELLILGVGPLVRQGTAGSLLALAAVMRTRNEE